MNNQIIAQKMETRDFGTSQVKFNYSIGAFFSISKSTMNIKNLFIKEETMKTETLTYRRRSNAVAGESEKGPNPTLLRLLKIKGRLPIMLRLMKIG